MAVTWQSRAKQKRAIQEASMPMVHAELQHGKAFNDMHCSLQLLIALSKTCSKNPSIFVAEKQQGTENNSGKKKSIRY